MMYYYPFLIYSSYILQHNGWKIALCVVKISYKPVISFNSTPTIQLQPKSNHVMVNIIIIFKTLELLPLTFINSFPFYYRIVAKWRKTFFVCYFNSNLVNRRVWSPRCVPLTNQRAWIIRHNYRVNRHELLQAIAWGNWGNSQSLPYNETVLNGPIA